MKNYTQCRICPIDCEIIELKEIEWTNENDKMFDYYGLTLNQIK